MQLLLLLPLLLQLLFVVAFGRRVWRSFFLALSAKQINQQQTQYQLFVLCVTAAAAAVGC